MRYPEAPKEKIYLSEVGERFKALCTSRTSNFKFLAVELCASRRPVPKGQELPRIRSDDDVKEVVNKLLPNLSDAIQESFGIICLDARFNVVGFAVPFTGGVASAPVEIATALKVPLLVATCRAVIIFHNHPSGEAQPSQDDILLTARFSEACELVGLSLLDHVIIGRNETYSFRSNGKLSR